MLNPVVEAARKLHPSRVWEDVSPRLYTTFWSLSLYDLYVPTARYEEEVRKAKEAIKELEEKMDMVWGGGGGGRGGKGEGGSEQWRTIICHFICGNEDDH